MKCFNYVCRISHGHFSTRPRCVSTISKSGSPDIRSCCV